MHDDHHATAQQPFVFFFLRLPLRSVSGLVAKPGCITPREHNETPIRTVPVA